MERVVNLNRWQREHVRTQVEMRQLFSQVKTLYSSDPFPHYRQRIQRLKTLKQALLENQQALVDALAQDYGHRSEFDCLIGDVLPSLRHLNYSLKHLRGWMKAQRRRAGSLLAPSKVKVEYQPLGVVGVMVPWNFPIFLSLGPIITALAAGNRVMVKLSEHTPKTNAILRDVFAELEDDVFPIEGDAEIASYFSQLPFDHLLFTGSTRVGRIVAQAAAQNLTPITLELGGKSPVIIAHDADLDQAVDAVMLGKSVNNGQVCVAPDYVFVPHGQEMAFVHRYLKRYQHHFKRQGQSATHIINEQQWVRLHAYLQDAKSKGARIHTLGDEPQPHSMMPHLVTEVTSNMLLMQQEIFGPILPVLGYQQLSDVLSYINSRPRPLALYLMTKDKVLERQVIEQTHSGTVAINDTLLQVAADDAPFGGIGESGMGHYHGIEGFRTFSKAKTVLSTPAWLPRSRILLRHQALVTKLMRWLFLR
ncbi:coniferyl-aldehyde dehydrogenase [Vibrio xiamenensis]|uniref:Aldehyde dehydrogenase n=1 Tax=Vibrio xiamenensis TaxID=861298 RepID=A0A1G7XI11_9VIBR|nr:coniferyl aldehyde dehydrogenase [Vibrio xiamenensis]SDG83848.1 coniferyl-aldehyde dehydrogenase [Vibrio xiamenensis]